MAGNKSLMHKTRKGDGTYDLEQQFILRMPPGPAMALQNDVETGNPVLKDKFYIELEHDMRHGCVRYGNEVFKMKLVDLPCVVESLKTTDTKSYYKTADISQMLVCVSDDESSGEENDANKKSKDKEKKYHWNHGITPPLKNVRKRRFRKTLKKKHPDQPEIEKEVKRLLRMDNESIDVKWEVVVEEENKGGEPGTSVQEQVLDKGGMSKATTNAMLAAAVASGGQAVGGVALADLFGHMSSSDEDDEKDVNIVDSGDDASARQLDGEESIMSTMSIRDDSTMADSSMADTTMADSTMADSSMADTTMADTTMATEISEDGELHTRLSEVGGQLNALRDQHLQLGMEVDMTDDPQLRDKLEAIIKEETEKENEYKILESMLNQ